MNEKRKEERVLIFEPLCGGHRAEFISHFLEYIRKEQPRGRTYVLVAGKGLVDETKLPSGVSLCEIDSSQERALAKASGSLGGFVFWRILKTYLAELKPDRLIIMDLTWLELPLCFHRPPCPFSGILFVQYPELRSVASMGWRRRIRFWVKEFKTRCFLRAAQPQKVFLLNGAFSCNYLNRRFVGARYLPIPDPVPEITAGPEVQLQREYGIEAGRRIFLFFGSMSARKGVGELVEAIQSLSMEAAQKAAFIFCGLPEPGYAQRYHELIENLVGERPDVCLHRDERFVSSTRMRALFEQADWILMPYTRPEYSSGILAHAAAAATPVIGPAEGLVGRQIREHGLGLDVPPDALSRGLEEAVAKVYAFDEPVRQAFVAASSPEQFAATLLEI